MQIAKSFVFQRNPVGGLKPPNANKVPESAIFKGSLPKKTAKGEYEEIGILKFVNDSIKAIQSSMSINADNALKFCSNILYFSNNIQRLGGALFHKLNKRCI